jgi:hypothetical protein
MSNEQEQINALPGEWFQSGRRPWQLATGERQSWRLDAGGLGVLSFWKVHLLLNDKGVWDATAEPKGMDEIQSAHVVAAGETARAALEDLANELDRFGSELVEASHELLNGC